MDVVVVIVAVVIREYFLLLLEMFVDRLRYDKDTEFSVPVVVTNCQGVVFQRKARGRSQRLTVGCEYVYLRNDSPCKIGPLIKRRAPWDCSANSCANKAIDVELLYRAMHEYCRKLEKVSSCEFFFWSRCAPGDYCMGSCIQRSKKLGNLYDNKIATLLLRIIYVTIFVYCVLLKLVATS